MTHATPHSNLGQQDAGAQGYREVLHDLIGMGASFARLLHDQATALAQPQSDAQPAPQHATAQPAPPAAASAPAALVSLAAAFDQVARAVRRCILLAQSLDKPIPPIPDPARRRMAARKQIIRNLEDIIQRPGDGVAPDHDTVEALNAELCERLDTPDLDDDLRDRPVAEIIEEIRRDLGLDRMPGTRPFRRRTPADVALLCARAAAPSAARQPAVVSQGAGPQGPSRVAIWHAPVPAAQSTAIPRAQSAPVHPGVILPADPAEAVALVLRHATRAEARWRPPPKG